MSVIVTLRVPGDPKALERLAAGSDPRLEAIVARQRHTALIAHRFYGSEDKILVIDEWPDAESFQRFFAEQEAEIGPMMQEGRDGRARGHLLDEARNRRRRRLGGLASQDA